jgi:P-type Mg2+ transporter
MNLPPFWSIHSAEALQQLQSTPKGLTSQQVKARLKQYGPNLLKPKKKSTELTLLLAQFQSPIILILIFAAGLSFFLHATTDALIILTIVLISGLLGFWQERGAADAVEKLLALVQTKATVLRDGTPQEVFAEEVVPGDLVFLSAGGSIPGDCLLLESIDLFVDEATLTGETYPVTKEIGILPAETPLAKRSNILFTGTHVVSGTATALVIKTGLETEFGQVSQRLELRPPETEFEQGIRKFGYFLMEVTLYLVIAIFAVNVYLNRPVLDSALFALALAVGLTPQLLPAIISINLARGAKRLAAKKVIVKRLAAIENFGSMNVLCSDKTGTITEGVVRIESARSIDGQESEKVLFYSYLNAIYETGFINPIDEAIRTHRKFDIDAFNKLDEVPYDFIRKRLSILVANDNTYLMITKGALPNILSVCSSAETLDGKIVDIEQVREEIQCRFETLGNEGFRILGIAYQEFSSVVDIAKANEENMIFLGCLIFFDPPKSDIVDTIQNLEQLGVSLKMITGDNHAVAAYISAKMGIVEPKILTGQKLRHVSDEALLQQVNEINVFAEVEPNQKERIIIALKKTGNVVGYIGDGINDASALHAADVGISVESAVDVAKEAADIVLLEKSLSVLLEGVREGRVTFANTLKYVFMATSANFGNMFSMAGASLFLSFLPLLPKQILLTNLMTDFPEITIAADRVDDEMVNQPRRWNIQFIRNFMLAFGSLSSIFDFLTFGTLLFVLKASPEQFRTGWFMESVISASSIVLVIRTRQPFFKSMPGRYLLIATLIIIATTLILPYTPVAGLFGFQPLPMIFLILLGVIVVLYISAAELMKKYFYRLVKS